MVLPARAALSERCSGVRFLLAAIPPSLPGLTRPMNAIRAYLTGSLTGSLLKLVFTHAGTEHGCWPFFEFCTTELITGEVELPKRFD